MREYQCSTTNVRGSMQQNQSAMNISTVGSMYESQHNKINAMKQCKVTRPCNSAKYQGHVTVQINKAMEYCKVTRQCNKAIEYRKVTRQWNIAKKQGH